MVSQFILFLFFARIKCNYLVEILDTRVSKAQNACLLCWKTWQYTTIFCLSFFFLLKLNEFNFDIVVQSLFGADQFGEGVIVWLINSEHVVVEGP
jgi:hypothetical protein